MAMHPIYYVRHPDDSYTKADPQPVDRASPPVPADVAALTDEQIDAIFRADPEWQGWPGNFNWLQAGLMRDAARTAFAAGRASLQANAQDAVPVAWYQPKGRM